MIANAPIGPQNVVNIFGGDGEVWWRQNTRHGNHLLNDSHLVALNESVFCLLWFQCYQIANLHRTYSIAEEESEVKRQSFYLK